MEQAYKTGTENDYWVRSCAWSAPGCHPVGCGIKLHVVDGKLVEVEGDEQHPITQGRLCVRCLTLPEYVNHPDRIVHPMKRAREDRGKDAWHRITWDEAIDEIVERTRRAAGEIRPRDGGGVRRHGARGNAVRPSVRLGGVPHALPRVRHERAGVLRAAQHDGGQHLRHHRLPGDRHSRVVAQALRRPGLHVARTGGVLGQGSARRRIPTDSSATRSST